VREIRFKFETSSLGGAILCRALTNLVKSHDLSADKGESEMGNDKKLGKNVRVNF